MSKVYILLRIDRISKLHPSGAVDSSAKIIGVISSQSIAERFVVSGTNVYNEMYENLFVDAELDDPELLNRIVKESEKK